MILLSHYLPLLTKLKIKRQHQLTEKIVFTPGSIPHKFVIQDQ